MGSFCHMVVDLWFYVQARVLTTEPASFRFVQQMCRTDWVCGGAHCGCLGALCEVLQCHRRAKGP